MSSAGKRILIVDDDTDWAQTLAVLLRRAGHRVETATNPLYAMSLATAFHPEFIFLDIGLPYMDGYDAARRFHANFKGARTFAVTGRSGEDARRKSLAAGFEDHLVKPVDIGTIEKILASKREGPKRQ
jgi:DNA-binding response OmpR family regulator